MGRMNKFTVLRAVIIAMKNSSSNLAEIIGLNLKQRASKMRQSPVVNLNRRHTDFQSVNPVLSRCKTKAYMLFLALK